MAKFTKTRAREPIGEGALALSYGHRNGEVSLSLRIGETTSGQGTWLTLEVSSDELDKIVEFRNRARERSN